MPTTTELMLILPELFLLAATCALLLLDLFLSPQRRPMLHFLAVAALLATAVLTIREGGPALASTPLFGGLMVRDTVGDVLKLAIYLVTAGVFVYARPYLHSRGLLKGEFYVLCLFAVLGMAVLVSAGNLLMVYLGLELLALSSYGLVALHRDNVQASEAAMKYFVLGSLASGMLLYGMSMIYGATGTLDLVTIHAAAGSADRALVLTGAVFLIAGIAFKFGAAPFHMWLPDVYHGAPTAVTLFIGSAPKLAAFGMAYRLLESGLGAVSPDWQLMIAWLAVLSLATGNLLALMQANLKRMLAYSTISHVGFLFLGLANGGPDGYAAAMFYAISYALMAAAGFATVMLLSRSGFESDQIEDFRGLSVRHPWYALLVLFVMASLAGIPFFLGFWAKLAVLRAAVQADMVWLAIVGVVFAVIGAFYYLRLVKVMYFDEPETAAPPGEGATAAADPQFRWLFSFNAGLLLALGLSWGPLMAWCQRAFGL